MKNPIYPCLWFNGNASEAAKLYCSAFKESHVTADTPMVSTFELSGQKFMGLNGGPTITPNASVSFFVVFGNTRELEDAWKTLRKGGSVLMPIDKYAWSEQYGWVQDRFGISWQLSYGSIQDVGQKFTPTLMFTRQQAGKAEDAIGFYTSIFDNSSVKGILKYSAEDEDVQGTVKHAQFKLGKHMFMAMDSSLSHAFNFNEGISFVVECENQHEIDYYWDKLSEGGKEQMCGWLKDPYGLSWQIIPDILPKMMSDTQKAKPLTEVIMQMKKFNVDRLVKAYERG